MIQSDKKSNYALAKINSIYPVFAIMAFLFILNLKALGSNNVFGDRGTGVLLQGFHWESHRSPSWWDNISDKADAIADCKIDAVWFPPSSASAAREGYLPTRLLCQDSSYGTSSALIRAIAKLRQKNIISIADIVINHRCGTNDWADFSDPQWPAESVCNDDEWPFAKGNADTGWGFHAGRDIDHTKPFVQESIIKWMNWLKNDIGYQGFRYDYVGGYSGYYNHLYTTNTRPVFSMGEFWDNLDLNDYNSHRQRLCNWIDSTGGASCAIDFTTKGILQNAINTGEYWRLRDNDGKPSGLIGWWPQKAVTFLDNHDTGPSTGGNGGQQCWPFPGHGVMQGYAYILTHPGFPCIYWPHLFDWNLYDQISKLVNIRKSAGINASSHVNIVAADWNLYAAIIDNKVAVKIGSSNFAPGNGWTLSASGNNWAVWKK